MQKHSILDKYSKHLIFSAMAIAALLILWGASWGYCRFQTFRAIKKAEAQLQKGFGALAAETLNNYRHPASRIEHGCKTLVSAYYQARQIDRLEWSAQACLEAGIELPESYLGLAAAKEFIGRDPEAIQILSSVIKKFPQSPDIYYRLGQILRRNKKDDQAIQAYLEASRRAPKNSSLAFEALEFFSSLQRWSEARQMAEALKTAPIENPEIKLIIARAFMRGGAPSDGQILVAEAKALMMKNPSIQTLLEQNYQDVLSETPSKPSARGEKLQHEKPAKSLRGAAKPR